MAPRKGYKHPNPNPGKRKGIPNRLTRTFKEILETALAKMQGTKQNNLFAWGMRNPDEFYKLCAKLIPAQLAFPDTTPPDRLSLKELGRRLAFVLLEAQQPDKEDMKVIDHKPSEPT